MSNRCCLCGGRIHGGRCEECGMPLQQASGRVISEDDRMKKIRPSARSEDSFEERTSGKQAEQSGDLFSGLEQAASKEKKKKKKSGKSGKVSTYEYRTGSAAGKPLKPQKKKRSAGIVAILSVVIALVGGVIVPLTEAIFDDSGSSYKYEDDSYEYDPYEYVEEELPVGEEAWSGTLEPGFYEVGVQLPVGEYTVRAEDGYGTIRLINKDLELEVSEYMDASPEDDAGVSELSGLRCYEGSILRIDSGVVVTLETDTAVADTTMSVSNTLTESYSFDADPDAEETVLIAGKDFPAGFYDFTSDQEYSSIKYQTTDSEGYDWSYYYSVYDCSQGVHNLLFPEGTEITIQGHVLLTPSAEIGENWDEYFYERVN